MLAGLMGVLGWGLMIVYVLIMNPHQDMITRDYVHYMTSNSILLGAEFDKIISILLVTGILAVALIRARRLLIASVSEKQASEELSRFFSRDVAQRIKNSDDSIKAGMAERREAAIINLDMRGFTNLAASESAEKVMGMLAEYQSLCVPVIQKHGGSIDKFMGDGIMATFGASTPSESYAANAMRAMDELMDITAKWTSGETSNDGLPRPSVNGSIAVGSILFGAVGDESRLEYTVIGDAVNLSAKLEKQNKNLGVRAIGDRLGYDRAIEQGYIPLLPKETKDQETVDGVRHPMDLVILAS